MGQDVYAHQHPAYSDFTTAIFRHQIEPPYVAGRRSSTYNSIIDEVRMYWVDDVDHSASLRCTMLICGRNMIMSNERTMSLNVMGDENAKTDKPAALSSEDLRDQVRAGYAEIARTGTLTAVTAAGQVGQGGCCGPTSSCCGPAGEEGSGGGWSSAALAEQIGYSPQEIEALPEGANMGLSCGNPIAIAALTAGQVVLDLGSGGGFDVFLAGPKVGATGQAIGVDMTPEMVQKARKGLAHYQKATGLDNVSFRLGEIEHLPVADASVDVVISNCVINLSVDKP